MTNPYARPDEPESPPSWVPPQDATIPLVPEQGYASRPSPWSEGYDQTAVDPLGANPAPPNYSNPTVGYPPPAPQPQYPTPAPQAAPRPGPASQAPYQVPQAYEQPPQGYTPYGQPRDDQPLVPVYAVNYQLPGQLPEHPNAVPTLVLALLGFMFGITFPIAWYLGARGSNETRRNPNRWRSSTVMTVGMVLGIIGTVLMLLGVAAFVLFLVVAIAAA